MAAKRKPPRTMTMTQRAEQMGCKGELVQYRENLKKREGMEPREAAVRAWADLEMEDRWDDFRRRDAMAVIAGKSAPLTRSEAETMNPSYSAPTVTSGAPVGEEILSLAEQVQWVKRNLARVRNGGDPPGEYPSADTLYWYQIAISRPMDFDKIVLKLESPSSGEDSAAEQDMEYQFREIEKQIEAARGEVGVQLAEYESEFHAGLELVSEN